MSCHDRPTYKAATKALGFAAVALALAPASGLAQTTAPLTGASASEAIPDQYIVVMKGAASDTAKERTKNKARARGGRVRHEYRAALKGYAANLPPAALAEVRKDPDVAYVEADAVVTASATQTGATWGLDRIDQRSLPLNTNYVYTPTGAGVKAYVIDTGVRFTHAQFGGRAVTGYDSVDGGSADDCNGHGTHVAGTIGGSTYGVAKGVTLVGVRVLNCQGSGSTSGVIAGINWVTTDHAAGQPATANMSLGGGASTSLDTAVQNSIGDGVTYAVAAGNENTNACNGSPSRVTNALTVGATTRIDGRASFSNYGTCVDLFAPGQDITSSWHSSNTATNTISGTSMASPHVAGGAALYLQGNTGASPATVGTAITSTATTGQLTSIETGSPNRLLYSLLTTGGQPPPPPPPPPAGCGLPNSFTGTLSGTGASVTHPGGTSYTTTTTGLHRGCLRGPASGADFDLYLDKRSAKGTWTRVAQAVTLSSNEDISYTGTAGTYRWRVVSYSGGGTYTFQYQRPT